MELNMASTSQTPPIKTALSMWLSPAEYPYADWARATGWQRLENYARSIGWTEWKRGFCRDEVQGKWHAWIWR
jgi:hypothetical protein